MLSDAGVRVFSVYRAADTFDNTSFLAVRWSLRLLRALGILGGLVVVAIELSIIDAVRRTRQLTHLFAARMGLTAAEGWTVVAIEMIPPLVVGAVIGSAAAVAVARSSVSRLDTIRSVPPVSLLAPVAPALLPSVVVVAAAAVATVAWAPRKPSGATRWSCSVVDRFASPSPPTLAPVQVETGRYASTRPSTVLSSRSTASASTRPRGASRWSPADPGAVSRHSCASSRPSTGPTVGR